MKSLVMALFISTYAAGSVTALAITLFAADPNFVWIYAALGLETAIAGFACWRLLAGGSKPHVGQGHMQPSGTGCRS
jgi:hypothetical protein